MSKNHYPQRAVTRELPDGGVEVSFVCKCGVSDVTVGRDEPVAAARVRRICNDHELTAEQRVVKGL